ncbi:MAG TPA: DUF4253 domain-containing protein [Candidatus Kapabacteria bacterium]|nr:DUF4253 domain-containing protein [Candidatus Kapabacteria bacterium]
MNNIQIVPVAGRNALAELQRLRLEYAATGLYPIILGDEEDCERMQELHDDGEEMEAAAIIAESRTIDVQALLRERRGEFADMFEQEDGGDGDLAGGMELVAHLDMGTMQPKETVLLGLLRVAAPWEVFAYLDWGGWNECPFAAEHCAMHRYWQARHGAEVVCVTADIVQCIVERPPHDRPAALTLAHEQYLYCADIVEQGTETVGQLADTLVRSPYWYFWWD